MTHSADRTMLARLGFGDADKRNDRHWQACKYLTQHSVASELIANFAQLPGYRIELNARNCETYSRDYYTSYTAYVFDDPIPAPVSAVEVPIHKGEGQYMTTIGFIDVVIHANWKARVITDPLVGPFGDDSEYGFVSEHTAHIAGDRMGVEVKAADTSIDAAIRQMRLYASYYPCREWLLATCFPVSQADAGMLRDAGIYHVYLGDKFERWLEEQKAAVSPSRSIEV